MSHLSAGGCRIYIPPQFLFFARPDLGPSSTAVSMLPAISVLGNLPPDALIEADRSSEGTVGLPPQEGTADGCSILKYEDPVLVRPHASHDMALGHDSLPQYVSLYATNERGPVKGTLHPSVTGTVAMRSIRSKIRPSGGGADITAVIKAIIPNKEFSDGAGKWVQTVSGSVRTRSELEKVQGEVDSQLAELQARQTPVCPVREQVLSELFDEVIREVTVQCPERGLLLLRLRDETRMNLDTYAEIYRDSFAFSRRKVEGAQQDLDGTRSLLIDLQRQTTGLQTRVRSLEADLASVNRSNAYSRSTTDHEHIETLRLAKEEQKALEMAISKSQKKLKEVAATAATGAI